MPRKKFSGVQESLFPELVPAQKLSETPPPPPRERRKAPVFPDDLPWPAFVEWFKEKGCRILWQGDSPPAWILAHWPDWDYVRELSVVRMLRMKGERLDTIRGVISQNRRPWSMAGWNVSGRWVEWESAKHEYFKSQRIDAMKVGTLLRRMLESGGWVEDADFGPSQPLGAQNARGPVSDVGGGQDRPL